MKIYYTNKLIFWNNESSDFLEKEKFDEYLNDAWIELSNVKSINWDTHYSANFYASDSFEATYFKVEKNGQVYYFFIDDITFDGANGRQFSLSLDLYNTYSFQLIEKLKQENPNVYFTRKHMNRYYKDGTNKYIDFLKQAYIFTPPSYLGDYSNQKITTKNQIIELDLKETNYNPQVIVGDEFTFSNEPYQLENKCYLYLRIKLSPNYGDSIATNIKLSPIVYVPILRDASSGANSYIHAIKYPSDYIVDMVLLPIPPRAFHYCAKIKDFYGPAESESWNSFKDDNSICLFQNLMNNGFIDVVIKNPLMFSSFNTILSDDSYNINTFLNEPMLYSNPYFDIVLFDKQITLPSFFYKQNGVVYLQDIGFNQIKYFAYSTFYLYLDYGLNSFIFEPNASFSCETKIPALSSVYTTYLNNNANSMNTSLQLANEVYKINANQLTANFVSSMVGSGISGGLGVGAAISTGGMFGLDAVGGAISDMIQAPIDYVFNNQLNNFNLKKTYAEQQALRLDLKNQVGDLKDVYGKGQLMSAIKFYVNELPSYIKKKIFSDIYFNGYIVETILPFSNYDNRINFNYFELKNVFALCSQYLKLPKSIMSSIAKQLESGIRLWKTPNFDYTLTLDNKENNYAIM